MADHEQLNLLRRSVADWNIWRQNNSTLRPKLSSANLQDAMLAGANLRGVSLGNANLQKADCRDTDCRGASFRHANLRGVIFDRSDLTGANFNRADLQGASMKGATLDHAIMNFTKLEQADLSGARIRNAEIYKAYFSHTNMTEADLGKSSISNSVFFSAILRRADFSRVKLHDVGFNNTDLSDARSLETVKTSGKNKLDKETRDRSGTLSLQFLFGVGLDEQVLVKKEKKAINVSFRRDLWAQLLPIEHALAAALGDKFSISKHSDSISITLAEPELLQAALDAVLPVLASLHVAVPGEVTSVSTEIKGLEPQLLDVAQLQDQLAYCSCNDSIKKCQPIEGD